MMLVGHVLDHVLDHMIIGLVTTALYPRVKNTYCLIINKAHTSEKTWNKKQDKLNW